MLATIFTFFADPVLAVSFGENMFRLVQSIIGPIFLMLMGIMSLVFAIRRQLSQFLIFLGLGVGIAAIIYAPNFIRSLGQGVAGEIKW